MTTTTIRSVLSAMEDAVDSENRLAVRDLVRAVPRKVGGFWAGFWRHDVLMLHYGVSDYLKGGPARTVQKRIEIMLSLLDRVDDDAISPLSKKVPSNLKRLDGMMGELKGLCLTFEELALDLMRNGIRLEPRKDDIR